MKRGETGEYNQVTRSFAINTTTSTLTQYVSLIHEMAHAATILSDGPFNFEVIAPTFSLSGYNSKHFHASEVNAYYTSLNSEDYLRTVSAREASKIISADREHHEEFLKHTLFATADAQLLFRDASAVGALIANGKVTVGDRFWELVKQDTNDGPITVLYSTSPAGTTGIGLWKNMDVATVAGRTAAAAAFGAKVSSAAVELSYYVKDKAAIGQAPPVEAPPVVGGGESQSPGGGDEASPPPPVVADGSNPTGGAANTPTEDIVDYEAGDPILTDVPLTELLYAATYNVAYFGLTSFCSACASYDAYETGAEFLVADSLLDFVSDTEAVDYSLGDYAYSILHDAYAAEWLAAWDYEGVPVISPDPAADATPSDAVNTTPEVPVELPWPLDMFELPLVELPAPPLP